MDIKYCESLGALVFTWKRREMLFPRRKIITKFKHTHSEVITDFASHSSPFHPHSHPTITLPYLHDACALVFLLPYYGWLSLSRCFFDAFCYLVVKKKQSRKAAAVAPLPSPPTVSAIYSEQWQIINKEEEEEEKNE